MGRLTSAIAGLAVTILTGGAAGAADPEAGERIVTEKCSPCHAVEASGDSPNLNAPPFRMLSQKWPLENLEEALGEGIIVGHGGTEMPEFVFEPEQISDIIAYLHTIQEN